ncbi:MAG TPA: AAA family ATPase [Methylomusa anaerophila]|uniref:Light-independent protochlorophyllide reductase iron-sulfur ATP-binding protein n=1 Tax=Methylomusa anaerophila TaxID=1930071 RepID=A0A348AFJ7_9FIRM|nr:ArsA-related P-loop ATPase [Methylomusa anaerophila]BBB89845.1 light-independent protochlorophyllide reductase iron-sulfur ATP-binding protein [Methylomusa anaerophila]HML89109.1 AAA family ATPase [Methylomusa anaerophila]
MKIALSGKGGVGKTSISASLAKLFSRDGHRVYAVDADPDASLGLALGIPDDILAKVVPLIEMQDVIKEKSAGGGAFYSLNPEVDDVLDEYSISVGNIKFLRMGGVKPGGSACYCRENSFLYSVIDSLLLNKDDVVILDMGAGIEHLTRGTSKGVDLMVVVTEPSKTSVKTARVVMQLAEDLGIEVIKVVANKIRSPKEEAFITEQFAADELLGMIRFDDDLLDVALGEGEQDILTGAFKASMEEIYLRVKGWKDKK